MYRLIKTGLNPESPSGLGINLNFFPLCHACGFVQIENRELRELLAISKNSLRPTTEDVPLTPHELEPRPLAEAQVESDTDSRMPQH